MRILFIGCPAIAVPSLRAISDMEMDGAGIVLAGVLTNPDSRRGRHGKLEPTDISAAASELDAMRKAKGLPSIVLLKPERLDSRAREEVVALAPDLLVSFAYGRIFGPRFLSLFPLGGINIHPSLLPKYRGATPIPAVILAQEKETGICIQLLAGELDCGDILMEERFQLSGHETTLSLSETVSMKAAALLKQLLLDFDVKSTGARPQQGEATSCHELKKETGIINWNKSAVQIDAQIRAYTPWPLSFTFRGEERLFILEAEPLESLAAPVSIGAPELPGTVLGTDRNGILIQTGEGILIVKRLQWQAKKALEWKAFCNGERSFIGTMLESSV